MLVGQLDKLELGLRELRRNSDVEFHERVDLRAWTALGVGGVAGLVARCHSTDAVGDILDLAVSHGLGWLALGGGSRLIASDRGIRVPVVSLTGRLARWDSESEGIVAGAGANLAQVCRAATRGGLSGLESLGSDGHSVGGLIRAAADGVVQLGGVLDWIDFRRPGCELARWHATSDSKTPSVDDLHRRIVVRVRFNLRPTALAEVKPRPARPVRTRALRTTGPVFLNSQDASVADLLAEAGCTNAAVGGVRLGGRNGNTLIAGRSANSTDVFELCRRTRDRVQTATGVELISALVFVDENGMDIEL